MDGHQNSASALAGARTFPSREEENHGRSFLPAFEHRANDLIQNEPYSWLGSIIAEESSIVLKPHGLDLRPDGAVFLLTNLADLVVVPWESATGNRFLNTSYVDLLRQDIRFLLQVGLVAAQAQQRSVVSANMLMQGCTVLGEGLTVRSLKLWGPPP